MPTSTWTCATAAGIALIGCDPVKLEEQAEQEAKAQAAIDSIVAAMQVAQDSAEAAAALDSTTIELDSGIWNIEEPGEEELEYAEVEETGLAYEDWKHVADDTVSLERRQFDRGAIAEYLKDPELDYDRTLEHDNLWWERFMRWLGKKLEKLFGTKGGRAVFNNIHWIILGLAVLFVAWYFRKHLFGGVFGIDAKKARQVTEIEENIEELDLDRLLHDAEKSNNWRLALRYQWLKVLRKLVDEGRIKWQPRFTDADYLAQLKEPALRVTFSELSFLFKWVWYGDAPMDAQRYQRLKPAFEAAHKYSAAKAPAQPVPADPVAP